MMNRPELEEHIRQFRRRVFALRAKHEVELVPRAEWRLVRPDAPAWAKLLLGLLIVSGCVWAVTERHWTGLAGLVLGALGVGRMWWKGMREHPPVEVIAWCSADGQTLTFPVAGLEWPIGEVHQMAIREVVLKQSHYSAISGALDIAAASGFNDGSRLWQCVYVFGESGTDLLFAQPWDLGNSGLEKALRTFCEAIGKPLMKPEPERHGPTEVSI